MDSFIPLIQTAGYIGVFGMIFAESGLLVGFIFPGDTLLFAAGILASKGFFNIELLIIGASFFAIFGDSIGYWIGKKIGPALFKKQDSLFFKQEYVTRANHFFNKHGKKTIFLCRYIPIVRTFAPVVAGVGQMQYKTFLLWNILGGITWCTSLGLAGYFLGSKIDNIDIYILPILAGIILVSFGPVIYHVYKNRKAKHE